MSKHTPGPWVVEGNMVAQAADAEDSVEIAFMAELGGPLTEEVRRANARLIAAAPDLLEALEFVSRAYDPEASSIERALAFYEAVNAARAAIAAATETKE